jgi:hypothetical protein
MFHTRYDNLFGVYAIVCQNFKLFNKICPTFVTAASNTAYSNKLLGVLLLEAAYYSSIHSSVKGRLHDQDFVPHLYSQLYLAPKKGSCALARYYTKIRTNIISLAFTPMT